MFRIILLLIITLVMTSCSNPIRLQLDAINSPDYQMQGEHYLLLSGDPNVQTNDLYFQEFSRFAHHALKKLGAIPTESEETATLKVFFSYGSNNGISERYTYSTPIYDYVGGDTYTIRETDTQNQTSTTEVYVPYQRRIVGREYHTQTITRYQSYMRIEGRKNDEQSTQQWMVTVEAVSDINDLRQLLPIMMSRAMPYIASNSEQVLNISVKYDDAAAQQLINEVNKE